MDKATAKQARIYKILVIIHIAGILLPWIWFNRLGSRYWDVDMGSNWHGPEPFGLTDIFALLQSAILFYSGDYLVGGRFVRILQVVGMHIISLVAASALLSVTGYGEISIQFHKGQTHFSGPPLRVLLDTELFFLPMSILIMGLWLLVRFLRRGWSGSAQDKKITTDAPTLNSNVG